MSMFPPVEEQLELVNRGVEQVVPREELVPKLQWSRDTGTPLRVKYGIDPTGIDVHLGHTVPLRKMRQFQELGHRAVIIIGNATALVGDPSGRDEARASRLTAEQVEQNARDYLVQVGKVVDLENAEIHRNGDWFGSMSFGDVLELCGKTTIQQLMIRDNFRKRMQEEKPVFLLECLYPVMQAFDSVVIGADVELGGTEQLYNFMLARDLQKDPATCSFAERWMPEVVKSRLANPSTLNPQPSTLPPQVGLMSPILVGTDGTRRMGKSLGNYIGIAEPAFEMAKKFMQVPDAVMRTFFELLTEIPLDEVDVLLAGHPKEAKQTLARAVIAQYHDAAAGDAAIAEWERQIAGGGLPDDIPERPVDRSLLDANGCIAASKLLVELKLVPTGSEAGRRIQGGAVFVLVDGDKRPVSDRHEPIPVTSGMIVRAGKKDWARVV